MPVVTWSVSTWFTIGEGRARRASPRSVWFIFKSITSLNIVAHSSSSIRIIKDNSVIQSPTMAFAWKAAGLTYVFPLALIRCECSISLSLAHTLSSNITATIASWPFHPRPSEDPLRKAPDSRPNAGVRLISSFPSGRLVDYNDFSLFSRHLIPPWGRLSVIQLRLLEIGRADLTRRRCSWQN